MQPAVLVLATLAFLVGALLGGYLGLNGFSQPATPGPLGQSPRVKNLMWLLSGFLPLFIGDFRKLGLPDNFPWVWPFVLYGFGALMGAACSIGWMLHSIDQSVRRFNRNYALGPGVDVAALRREYLTFGKTRYEELWSALTSKAEAAHRGNLAQRTSDADKLQAKIVYGVFG
jgi:hypothetical protein